MGGRAIKEIAPAMIEGLYKALAAQNESTLRDIFMLVYSLNEVSPMQTALDNAFELVKP